LPSNPQSRSTARRRLRPDLSFIAEPLRRLAVPVSTLNLDPTNARRHPDRNREATRASLERHGQVLPVVVQRQGMVVRVGNLRLELARELGWSHLAAVVVDKDDVDAVALAIVENRSGELAEWHDAQLVAQLFALREAGLKEMPAMTGFDAGEIDRLLGLVSEAPFPELSAATERGTGQMTFILLPDQEAVVKDALQKARETSEVPEGNRNGCALYAICRDYLDG